MGNDRKSKHATMWLARDEKAKKNLSELQTRRAPYPRESDSGVMHRHPVRYRTMDRASVKTVTFNVSVIFDNEENVWVAECDALGIVTEAKSFEGLTKQVQELVPDMIEANQIQLGGKKPFLNFSHLEEAVI
ncbi:DUF1902 domain-containing protein [Acinetobacter calcoaceticus]|uniref:DUF1902 domain-containing protein n=1 Tax=Acinetobacter calcoaceticus TaxID=471 RepID=A0ABD5AKW7_ACICA|nr:DUF1902 domain-containing protein [Acinetobacter calcoaceticus]MDP9803223.1 hypothetical protein [Acinetobacter calcoaceticus]